MKKIAYITIAITLLYSLSACKKSPQNVEQTKIDDFISTATTLGIYSNTAGTYLFDEKIHQTSVSMSATDYKFRIQTDDQKSIFAVEIAQFPEAIGTEVEVKVISTIASIVSKTYVMTAVKESTDMVWFWDKNGSVGMALEIP